MKDKKYIVTHWINEYDCDGLTCRFEVLGAVADIRHGRRFVTSAAEAAREIALKKHASWRDMPMNGAERPTFGDVNAKHAIVASCVFKIGDGTGYESAYHYFDLIEVDIHEPVDAAMFDRDGRYAFEINQFFDTWDDKMMPLFSAEEGRAWLKRNPGKTPPQGWKKFKEQLEALENMPKE